MNLRHLKQWLTVYTLGTLFLMEGLFRWRTTGFAGPTELTVTVLFVTSWGLGLMLVSSLGRGRNRLKMTQMLLGLTGVLYGSQMVYYGAFRTVYTVYSATNAFQALVEFPSLISGWVAAEILWLGVLFLPVFLPFLMKKKLPAVSLPDRNRRLLLCLMVVVVHLAGVGALFIAGSGFQSPAHLYFEGGAASVKARQLGVLTFMRLDLQQQVLREQWAPAPSVPEPVSESVPGTLPSGPQRNPASTEREDVEPVAQNVLEIDFAALMKQEENRLLLPMYRYFSQVTPTAQNPHTGIYEGYNLVMITAEAFAPYGVVPEVTPTLYKMIHEGIHFTDYHVPLWDVSTTDGEYVACTGLLPRRGTWSFSSSAGNYLPFALGNQLGALGYRTVAYHNHTYTYYDRHRSHTNMGYTYTGVGNGLEISPVWPASDLEMMEATIPDYIGEEPFHAYYMTVSGHLNYTFTGNSMAHKNREVVRDLPFSEEGRAYIATQVELDRALEHLLAELEKAGVAQKTLIVLSSDHFPYGLDNQTIEELSGESIRSVYDLFRSNLILYVPGMTPETIDSPVSSLDLLPTVSNLMGLSFDSRLLMGRDVFSDAPPLVIFADRSFRTEHGFYDARSGSFTASAGQSPDKEYIETMIQEVENRFAMSALILDYDVYRILLGEQK